jgi:integrase
LTEGELPAAGDALPPWTLHDLRRTAVTGMAELGVAPHVVEAVVNHVSGHKGGIAGVYNRATYAAEKREALQRWADHVERLAAGEVGGNVVAFGR